MSGMRLQALDRSLIQPTYRPEAPPPAAEASSAPAVSDRDAQEPASKTLFEMMQEAREKAEAHKKAFELPKNGTRYADAPVEAYARLSRARNRAQISAASGYARRCIAQFKAAARQDSENAPRIRAAIRQLQKAVNRAGKKKRDLEREELMDSQRTGAEQREEQRAAQRLEQELRRRRTLRVIRESGYVREAVIDNQLQAHLAATRAELQSQAQSLPGAGSFDAAIRQYAEQPAEPAPAPAIDLEV